MELSEILRNKTSVKEMIANVGMARTFEFARAAARFHVDQLSEQRRISYSSAKEGEGPTIHLVRENLPEAWEDTTLALMGIGQIAHTGYDPTSEGGDYQGEFQSFPSIEGTVMMHINDAKAEPRLHKGYLGGWLGLGSYIAEVEGVHDHWMISPAEVVSMIKKGRFNEIRRDDRWNYTYHQRLTGYPYLDIEAEPKTINQLDQVVRKLTNEPLSKSAQAITWDPRWDHNDGQMGETWSGYHSPCLQRLWFRLLPFKNGFKLNTNSHWRSRDHFKAVPQNIIGVTEAITEPIRLTLQDSLGVPVERGRYVDISDSLHLYGHYFDPAQQGLDAEKALGEIFKVARGEPIKNRLIFPGTEMYDIAVESINEELNNTRKNPDAVREV